MDLVKMMAANGQGKRALGQARVMLQDLKKRRQDKLDQGLPVMGLRVRQRRIRKGRPVPLQGGIQTTQSGMPIAIQTTTIKRPQANPGVLRKVEYNKPVLCDGNVAPSSTPLNPMNTDLFKALPNIASQYQYFKFEHITFNYVHSIDTQNPGIIGFGIAASSATASSTDSFDKMSGLNSYVTTNIYNDTGFSVRVKDFNQQYSMQGCLIKPFEVTDDTDPQTTPGYLIMGMNNTTAAVGTPLGTLTISYGIRFYKEKVEQDPQGPPTMMMTTPNFAASNDWWPNLITVYNKSVWLHKSITLTRISLSQLRITFSDTRTYAITFHGFGALAAPSLTTALTNCVLKADQGRDWHTTTHSHTWVVQSNRPGSYIQLENTGTQAQGVSLHIHAVKSGGPIHAGQLAML